MGKITRTFDKPTESIETECYIYASTELKEGSVKRVKIPRALWDTGASCSLISTRVAKVLGLESIGKTGVSGYNSGVDVRDTYLVHVGLPTGDIVTNIQAMDCGSDEYDAVIGMDIIGKGDFAITHMTDKTKFSFQIPSATDIDFTKE